MHAESWQRYNKDERHSSLRKNIPLTLLKGLCVRGSWRLNRIATYWPPTLLAIRAFLSRSPGLLNRGPASLGHGPHSSIFSPTDLSSNCSIGVLGGPPLLGAGSLYRILSPTASNFLCTELYYCFTPHSISSHNWPTEYVTSARLWNGMFDYHRLEITVMQFTGHPLAVHQFVTAPWDFNLVPYCQPSSPTQSLLITGQRNMQLPPSLNGMFDYHRAEIIVMQVTGHPLPVHPFVTAPLGF